MEEFLPCKMTLGTGLVAENDSPGLDMARAFGVFCLK